MDRRSKHLNSEERGVIFAEHQRGNSQQGIGRLLGRPASTIGRELARGRQDDGRARRVYNERRARCHLFRRVHCPATLLMKVRDIAGGDFGGSGSRAWPGCSFPQNLAQVCTRAVGGDGGQDGPIFNFA